MKEIYRAKQENYGSYSGLDVVIHSAFEFRNKSSYQVYIVFEQSCVEPKTYFGQFKRASDPVINKILRSEFPGICPDKFKLFFRHKIADFGLDKLVPPLDDFWGRTDFHELIFQTYSESEHSDMILEFIETLTLRPACQEDIALLNNFKFPSKRSIDGEAKK